MDYIPYDVADSCPFAFSIDRVHCTWLFDPFAIAVQNDQTRKFQSYKIALNTCELKWIFRNGIINCTNLLNLCLVEMCRIGIRKWQASCIHTEWMQRVVHTKSAPHHDTHTSELYKVTGRRRQCALWIEDDLMNAFVSDDQYLPTTSVDPFRLFMLCYASLLIWAWNFTIFSQYRTIKIT